MEKKAPLRRELLTRRDALPGREDAGGTASDKKEKIAL